MGAAFEFIENGQGPSPKGNFITKGDQTRFKSAFYPDDTGPEVSVLSKDGRARLGFTEWIGEKGARNIVKVPGMTSKMKEYIVPAEAALKFEQYAGAISEDRVASYLETHMKGTNNGTEVGVSSSGQQETIVMTAPRN